MARADHRLAMRCQLFAAGKTVNRHWRVKHDLDPPLPQGGQRVQQMRRKCHLAPPAVIAPILALGRMIDHAYGLNLQNMIKPVAVKRRKQRRFKRQNPQRVGAGAFGEKQQPVIGPQPRLENRLLAFGLGALARDKHRASRPRQPADQRPIRHLGFRDKIDPLHRVQRENVQPRRMIGHHRAAMHHRLAAHLNRQPQNRKGRPTDGLGDKGRPRPRQAKQRPLDQPQRQQNRQAAKGHRPQNQPAQDRHQPIQRPKARGLNRNLAPIAHASCPDLRR